MSAPIDNNLALLTAVASMVTVTKLLLDDLIEDVRAAGKNATSFDLSVDPIQKSIERLVESTGILKALSEHLETAPF